MAKSRQTIIAEIAAHVADRGGTYPDWYVGITEDPRRRLFTEHNVDEAGGHWIYRECDSAQSARAIEKHFLNLGMQGGPGGGDNDAVYVYVYRTTPETRE